MIEKEWKKPQKKGEIYTHGISMPTAMKLLDEYDKEVLGIDVLGRVFYKNYKIKLVRYPKGHEVGPYPGHLQTDIYLPNVVYAIGFEQNPTLPYGEKHGRVIGIGKTKTEALRNAKRWIDEQKRKGLY